MTYCVRRRRETLWWEQDGKCFYCDKKTKLPNGLSHGRLRNYHATVDEIVPLSAGGGRKMDNQVMACFECNNGRSDQPADQFLIMKRQFSGNVSP